MKQARDNQVFHSYVSVMYRSSCYIICICVKDKYLSISVRRDRFLTSWSYTFSISREYVEILCAFIFLGLFLEISSMQNLNLSAILNVFYV